MTNKTFYYINKEFKTVGMEIHCYITTEEKNGTTYYIPIIKGYFFRQGNLEHEIVRDLNRCNRPKYKKAGNAERKLEEDFFRLFQGGFHFVTADAFRDMLIG